VAALNDALDEGAVTSTRVRASASAAWSLYLAGAHDEAHGLLGRALSCAGDVELDVAAEGTVLGATGFHAYLSGNIVGYVDALRAETELLERTGDRSGATLSRAKLAGGLLEIGNFDEAERLARAALKAADQHGYESASALAHATLGRALALLGRLDEAIDEATIAVSAYAAQGAIGGQGSARAQLAALRSSRGELADAEREGRLALELVGTSTEAILAPGVLSRIVLARGDARLALELADSAMRRMEAVGGLSEGDALVRLARAEALLASGQDTLAHEVLSLARDRLLTRVAEIGEAPHRRALLEQVPEHRRTLELAR
jgi:tetratricopeptide (TPR) repeat protein